ncbi:hypothetical protein [Costertonia aggregata]|uniref:Uncharacterized protein n=1 Tax=Costertonia aggregata TaxID=343403 RepID=A0A7H9ARV2_9FLAO|nr:hypothetical protein [Costertonia aggregata]QLG46159.1 hypothetical protein HYG79_12640 [Costertonia aggregata]
MESKKYLEDISEIKNMMSRSSRFISLSGISGVLAGVYALIGAAFAHVRLQQYSLIDPMEYYKRNSAPIETGLVVDLFAIAIVVMLAALVTGTILSIKKAKKSEEKIWNASSRRLVINFFLPLLVGGIFCLVLIQYHLSALVASTTLVFYGLACINASKYTLGDVRYMGIAFVLFGLASTQFLGYGLYFWAIGFGLFHIFYGTLMYFKYDRK